MTFLSENKSLPISDPKRRHQSLLQNEDFLEFLGEGPYLNGAHVPAFENELSEYLGSRFCIGVSSGTGALELALLSLNLPEDASVLVPANAGGYASMAVVRNKLSCNYYDVDEKGLPNIELLSDSRRRTDRVLIVTHLYGQSAPMEMLTAWCDENDLFLIEDCAQAIGAEIKNKKVGTFGDIGTFSFYPTKNLGTIGDAGEIGRAHV